MLSDVIRSRLLIKHLAINEFRGRYSGQVLGSIWAIVQPLTMIAMYTLIFAVVLKIKVGVKGSVTEFGLFLIGGILPFNSVADSIRRSAVVYMEQSQIMRRIPMPPVTLVATRVVSVFIEFGIALTLYVGLLFVSGEPPGPLALGILVLLPLQMAMALGIAVSIASLTVLVKDISALTESLLTIWFLATPVFYPREMVPGILGEIIDANPMTPLVEAFRGLLLGNRLPPLDDMIYLTVFSCFFLMMGHWIYRHTRSTLIDHV